jgi:PAS domain S-box-containing protein
MPLRKDVLCHQKGAVQGACSYEIMRADDRKIIINTKHYVLNSSIIMLTTAVIYFLAARLSLQLAVGGTTATSVWPPSGIALAVILIWGYRMGPAVLIGAFFANILTLKGAGLAPAYYVAASLVTAIGNMLEGIIGAYLIKRFTATENPFNTIKDLFVFIILGSLVSTMVSATMGVGSYCFVTEKWSLFTQLWITWWLGDAAGVLIVSPIIIILKKKPPKAITRIQFIEAVIVVLVLMVFSVVIFWYNFQLEYMIIPPLLWIALRFGRLYSTEAVFLVSGIAVICTINPGDPSSNLVSHKTLLYLQTYIGVISIITLCLSVLMHERSESDKSRRASQKQLYDIIEFLPGATFAIDKNGKVIAWNRAMEDLSGIAKKDMIGKADYEYAIPFYGERRPMLIDLVTKITDPKQIKTYERIEKKGDILFVEVYNSLAGPYLAGAASALIDSKGIVYGAIESIWDISDRKIAELELKHHKDHLEEIIKERSAELVRANEQLIMRIEDQDRAEMALAESERNYRDLVESANSVIMRWKPDGSVTFFNTYAQKFFGFTESEIHGKNIMGTIVPVLETSGRDLSLLIEDIIRNPEAHTFNENENTRKNGEKVWIAWTNKPVFDKSGSIMEILSVGNDITERKNMEESLKKTLNELAIAKERAEAADRIKSAFLATMSHELRTPLNSIIGFTGILLQNLAGPLNDEQKKQMGMVRGSAQHLLSLINDVLDISKIEAGQFEVHAEPIDLRAIIEKAAATLKPSADKKGLLLNIIIGAEVDRAIGDQRRVEQVLLNMLSNAVKFTERGTITLSAAVIPEYRPPGVDRTSNPLPAVQCRVTDTGIGIRPDDLRELFQPFRQIDTGLSRKNEGTGLGLAICRRLADLMGGEIIAESVWGQGSTFTFTLPLKGTENETDDTVN